MAHSTICHFLKIRQVALNIIYKTDLITSEVREWARYEVSARILETMLENEHRLINGAVEVGTLCAGDVLSHYHNLKTNRGVPMFSPSANTHTNITVYRLMGIWIDLGYCEDVVTLKQLVKDKLLNRTTTKQMGVVSELKYPYVMVPYVVDVFLTPSV